MSSERVNVFEERHYTVTELADMWKLSTEFVRQIVRGEPGVVSRQVVEIDRTLRER